MENHLLKCKTIATMILVAFLLPLFSAGQSSWERFEIDFSDCSALFPSEPEWSLELSEDSSYVWVGEVVEGDIFFGVICIEFAYPLIDASDDELILVAEDYLDYLQSQFEIVSHTGYLTGLELEDDYYATGIADSWEDAEGDPWVIRCWIDHFNMAVMYMYSSPDVDLTIYEDYFFDSFWFPE
jgi:hypothetical protein